MEVLLNILKLDSKYGDTKAFKNKVLVIDFSSPNIAKAFGLGQLRTTIIGNSLANIYEKNGGKVVRLNYLGDWGTQFGKLMCAYSLKGNKEELEKNPIEYMQSLYVWINKNMTPELEAESRHWFKRLEDSDKTALDMWRDFRVYSLKELDEIYKLFNISFTLFSAESEYKDASTQVFEQLTKKGLLVESDGALIVDLKEFDLGVAILKKADGTTSYISRDIAAAIDRKQKFKFDKMIYEVGQEQQLHFKQLIKILELMGYDWSKNITHVWHGLYLGADGLKLSTRAGTSGKAIDIWNNIAKEVTEKFYTNQNSEETVSRIQLITRAILFFFDLKSNRLHDTKLDIPSICDAKGDTGSFVLYNFARAKSILKNNKVSLKKFSVSSVSEQEFELIQLFDEFDEIVKKAMLENEPSVIANYSLKLTRLFSSLYSNTKFVGSDKENFLLAITASFVIIQKECLSLLGIETLDVM
jgi:arginyl-tRNA synthetase